MMIVDALIQSALRAAEEIIRASIICRCAERLAAAQNSLAQQR